MSEGTWEYTGGRDGLEFKPMGADERMESIIATVAITTLLIFISFNRGWFLAKLLRAQSPREQLRDAATDYVRAQRAHAGGRKKKDF